MASNAIIKQIEFKYSGNFNISELPPNCLILEDKIIRYNSKNLITMDNADDLYREIERNFVAKLILNDEPFELRYSKWIIHDEEFNIEREISFSEGTYTIGIRNFEAKPIEINEGLTFNFQNKAQHLNQFLKELEAWLNDDDIDYMIDTYNIGLRKGSEELFYMYAVYECIMYKNSNGDTFITKILGLKKEDKKFIENYCNNKNIRKSRHSGRIAGKGNDTGGNDLRRLRTVIKELIIRYAYYINSAQNAQ